MVSLFRKNRLKYSPRYVIYLAVTRYLKEEQIACLNYDLKHSKISQTTQFLTIVERYFDIEHFKDRPIIWQDIWLYYYLKHELKSKLMKKGFIKQYEKEIIEPKNIAFGELFDSYKMLGLC